MSRVFLLILMSFAFAPEPVQHLITSALHAAQQGALP